MAKALLLLSTMGHASDIEALGAIFNISSKTQCVSRRQVLELTATQAHQFALLLINVGLDLDELLKIALRRDINNPVLNKDDNIHK